MFFIELVASQVRKARCTKAQLGGGLRPLESDWFRKIREIPADFDLFPCRGFPNAFLQSDWFVFSTDDLIGSGGDVGL